MKSVLLFLAAMAMPGAACAAGLTGQHAVYDLTLSKVRTHDVTGAVGQMSFDVVDGCTGWATTQHLTLLVRNVDGTLNKSVTDYITWESKDGKTFTFSLRERDNDGKVQVDDAGTAVHTGADNTGIVTYTTPADTRMALPPGTLFPMQHTEALLAAGRDGKKFIAPPLFDGTTPDGAQATFVAVLGHHGPTPTHFASLSGLPSSDVDIAFYPRKPGDQNPDFRTQMRYFEDGVATNLVLDFGDFVMTGKLAHLTIPPSACR
ncbi:EipB family protein [Acidocella sp.]|jgi:hypothetical protein|uniref:EipB family protein n=1 Tax=Acidocella sp. TaxID=50710 RepID=UPI002F430174